VFCTTCLTAQSWLRTETKQEACNTSQMISIWNRLNKRTPVSLLPLCQHA
jgi:hypothetical protein